MKTILEKNSNFAQMVGVQKIDDATDYRFLNFIAILEHKGVMLLMNTLTRQLISLSIEEYEKIKNNVRDEIFNNLVNDYFLVPIDFDDLKLKEQFHNIIEMLENRKGITKYVIMSTMECNARCFYCFEHGAKRYPMTDKTAEDVADFIIKKSLGQKVKIQWFGGEPLYNLNPINIISEKLANNNIEYSSFMISNGYLFNEENVKTAKEKWNLKSVQITLDGTEDIYNKTKAYIYKDIISPFEIVLNNIYLLISNGINVFIRINMDKYNKDDLYKLVDILDSRFTEFKNNFFIYTWLLYDNRGVVKSIRDEIERHQLTEEKLKLEEYIYSKGLHQKSKPKSKVRLTSCLADSDHVSVILPDGKLGKCDHHSDDEFYGSIYSDEIDNEIIKSWKELREPVELCKTCPLVPECLHLKKCPDDGAFDCDKFEQKNRLTKLYYQMRNAFDEFES